ncbi:Uu.00g104490.m01.CDS01 [Anthostomella pinea]|uniref:Uu.00g104490.m01.CDS01 n=1 Tax=Anthostomella pinea TaxID=933095 RepID=A0AAI8VDU9_9PEZI|nr:Uu.00g104490.m01.CDS01 [Anthostomella pinea]
MTGATGHVESVGDKKLKSLGAQAVRGDLHVVDVLRREAAQADIVMHFADSFLDQSKPKEYAQAIRSDAAAVDALAEPLRGTDKTLLVTSSTLVVAPDNGKETNEDSPADPRGPLRRAHPLRSERHAVTWAEKGRQGHLCPSRTLRLRPRPQRCLGTCVLAGTLQGKQAKPSTSTTATGRVRPSMSTDDAARLYLLAARNANKGDVVNATGQTELTARQLANAFAAACYVPAVSIAEE